MTSSPRTPTIGVVIPAFNESRYIDACLSALTSQTSAPEQIILVDNNCTDDTVERASRYPGVTVVAEPRQGISYARSTGFDAVTCDVIARIDADTIVTSNWTTAIRRAYQQCPEAAGFAGAAGIQEISPRHRFWGTWYYAGFRRWHERSIGVHPMMYGFNSMLTVAAWRAIREVVSFGDACISEDVDVTISLLKAGFDIEYRPDIIVKCHLLRTIKVGKLSQYYQTDNMTLAKHQYGNPSRWKAAN